MPGTEFGQPLHRPLIMLVAKRPKQTLPQSLLPAGLPGAGLEMGALGLQAHQRGLAQKRLEPGFIQRLQGRATLPNQTFRERLRRLAAKPKVQFAQGRVQKLFQRQRRQVGPGAALPDYVQRDLAEGGVNVVVVGVPSARLQVHLHITRLRRLRPDLDHRLVKIRAGFAIPKSRMQHLHAAAVQGEEALAQEPLVIPYGLQQPLGRHLGSLL